MVRNKIIFSGLIITFFLMLISCFSCSKSPKTNIPGQQQKKQEQRVKVRSIDLKKDCDDSLERCGKYSRPRVADPPTLPEYGIYIDRGIKQYLQREKLVTVEKSIYIPSLFESREKDIETKKKNHDNKTRTKKDDEGARGVNAGIKEAVISRSYNSSDEKEISQVSEQITHFYQNRYQNNKMGIIRNDGKITWRQITVGVSKLKGAVTHDSQIWEKITILTICILDYTKKDVSLIISIDGQFGSGINEPGDGDYIDLEPRYTKKLSEYAGLLLMDLSQYLEKGAL